MTQSKNAISALELMRQLGASYRTAFAAAVQAGTDARPRYMRLTPVKGFNHRGVEMWLVGHAAFAKRVAIDCMPL
jgi:hypothetical protein